MELRILGAHNMESKDTRMESHLIDGVLAIDAGGLTGALSFEEQQGIRAVILSHRHFDHVRDVIPLGATLRGMGVTVEIYAIKDTIDFVADKLLDGSLYPDFLHSPTPENPILRLHAIEFYQEFKVLEYSVLAVPVPHSVPAAGFQISAGETRLFYTGDAGKGLSDAWQHVSPSTLLTEVTFGNENEERALAVGHLTPRLLEEALISFKNHHGYYPKVIVAHMNPEWETAIRGEMGEVSERLGLDVLISQTDTRVAIQHP